MFSGVLVFGRGNEMKRLRRFWKWYIHPKWDDKMDFLFVVVEARILMPLIILIWLIGAVYFGITDLSGMFSVWNITFAGINVLVATLNILIVAMFHLGMFIKKP